MAGQIKVDSINADSNLALKIANTTVAFIDSSGLRPTSGNVNLDATATSKFYLPSANTVAIQTAGVTGLSISSAQVVTLAGTLSVTGVTTLTGGLNAALPVLSGGTGVTTSTGSGANVLGTSPTLTTPIIDTLNTSSGVLATQNGMTGIAKAWVNFAGATGTRNSSFNVGSVTRNSTGTYTVNFTTAMTSSSYVTNINVQNTGPTVNHPICWIDNATPPTTSAVKVRTIYYNNTDYDYPAVFVSVLSS